MILSGVKPETLIRSVLGVEGWHLNQVMTRGARGQKLSQHRTFSVRFVTCILSMFTRYL